MGVVSQSFYCIPQPNLVRGGGQLEFLLYTPAESGSWGWSARVSIEYLSQIWFVGVVSHLKLVCWGGQPGFLLYTPAESGLWGWSAMVPIVYPSQLWFVGVVSQTSYCIPQPILVH